jgi:outer membrane lipoprotein-sorting protein
VRPAAPVDLTATLSQIEANVDIEPAAFTVTVPPGARELTLDELRAAGPLRGES